MESLYKRRGKVGLADRAKRSELSKQNSKAKKAEVIDSRRRLPLGELNVADPRKDANSKKSKSGERLQKLREWQKARQEAKAKANADKAKKPVFVVNKKPAPVTFNLQLDTAAKPGNKNSTKSTPTSNAASTKPNSSLTQPSKNLKGPHCRVPVGKAAVVPKSKVQAPPPSKKTSTAQTVQQPQKNRPTTRSLVKTQPMEKSQPVTRAQRPKSATQPARKPATQDKPNMQAPPKATFTRHTRSSHGNTGRVQRSTRQSSRISPPSVLEAVIVNELPSSPKPLVIEVPPSPPPPSTPSKKYRPICPSPLLQSRSARYRANSEPVSATAIFIDDPAWIPGASAPKTDDSDKFEGFADSFSPFKFGTSNTNFQFTFKKEIDLEPPCEHSGPQEVSPSSHDGSSTDKDRKFFHSPLRKKCSPSKKEKCSPLKKEKYSPLKKEKCSLLKKEKCSPLKKEKCSPLKKEKCSPLKKEKCSPLKKEKCSPLKKEKCSPLKKEKCSNSPLKKEGDSNSSSPEEAIDIPRFRQLHSDVCEKLVALCNVWEDKMAELEQSDSEGMEEVLGQIRSAIGSSQLLMKQKLRQYIGLVDSAQTQSGHRRTTAEDLQGFWDMVYHQVDNLFKMFSDLEELEKNNWETTQPSPKKRKVMKSRNPVSRKTKKKACSEASSERVQATRKKVQEQRAELRRLKMKARQQQQAMEEEEGGLEKEEVEQGDIAVPEGDSAAVVPGNKENIASDVKDSAISEEAVVEEKEAVEKVDEVSEEGKQTAGEEQARSEENIQSTSDSSADNQSTDEELEEAIDIPRFRQLHSDVCEKLVALCNVWEDKMDELEQSDSEGLEEVLGQIRSAIGSSQLLMKQKLRQYIGLVDSAQTQSGHRRTTAEDLQGFWDMVYHQVENLFKMFSDLEELEKNNWETTRPSPKKRKVMKSRNPRAKKEACSEASSERAQAARKKAQEQRAELRRLKMKARQQQQAMEEEEGGLEKEEVEQGDIAVPESDSAAVVPENKENMTSDVKDSAISEEAVVEEKEAVEKVDEVSEEGEQTAGEEQTRSEENIQGTSDSSADNQSTDEELEEAIDIPRFRQLHSDVCEKLVALCNVWEDKMDELEQSDSEGLEEVLGQIRSAIGSSQLLMKQKLRQYIGLVDSAQTQSGHRRTTAEDLQGFWDMVYHQVENLFKMFSDLEELEKNNWETTQPSPKKRKVMKSRNPWAKKKACSEASSERAQAARKKAQEQRAELRRLKMKARQQQQQAMVEEEGGLEKEEVEEGNITVPEKKGCQEKKETAVEESASEEQTGSDDYILKRRELEEPVCPSPLRRSARIRNRSVFSPMCSPALPTMKSRATPKRAPPTQQDVPTGLLITF